MVSYGMYVCMRMCMYSIPSICICIYIYVCVCVFMYLCVCVYLVIYVYMHIRMYKSVWIWLNLCNACIYIYSLGNSRFTKRTWTNLGRSHHLPHVCTKMIFGMFWGVLLKGKWCRRHNLRRGHCYLGRSHRLPHVCRISFLPMSGSSIYTFSYMIVPQKVISWFIKFDKPH